MKFLAAKNKLFKYLDEQKTLEFLVYTIVEGHRHIDCKIGTIDRELKLKFINWNDAHKQLPLIIYKMKDYEKRTKKRIEKEAKEDQGY